jgi:hypothetical protein
MKKLLLLFGFIFFFSWNADAKGVGELSVIRNKTGRLKITKLQGRKLSRAQTVNLTFWGRPPSLK